MQPTSSPVKVGVIGIGNMGWHHARVLSLLKDANLIGVADPNEERGKLAIEQFQCEWFKDYKDLIPKVDAICIAVPTLLHHKVGIDCLNGGTNVLIEKPIAANELEAKSLIEAANASKCLLQVGHIERFNPAFRELNNIVHNEEIVVLEARRHSPHADRANDVSVVMDLMIHDIDLILELVNSKIQKLAAVGGRNSEGLIDYVNATLVFKNNVIASLTASKMSHKKIRNLKSIREFDQKFTAPSWGFDSLEDYYVKASPIFRIQNSIKKLPQMLFIHAKDDPWVPYNATLNLRGKFIDKFTIFITEKGGHNGFHSINGCWSDEVVKNWFISILDYLKMVFF